MSDSIEIRLDEEHQRLIAAEAEQSGRSVDEVIAECIDIAFDDFRRARLMAETRVQHFPAGDNQHHADHRDEEFLSPEDDA